MTSKIVRLSFAILAFVLAGLTAEAAPLDFSQSFGASSIPLNGTTSLTFLIDNGDFGTHTGVALTDTLPSGLQVSTPNGLTGSCGGTITAVAGSGTISLSGGVIPAGIFCVFSVNVTATSTGVKVNTPGNISSTEGGVGGTTTSTLHVDAPLTVGTSFSPGSVALGVPSGLNFLITNPGGNPDTLTGVSFNDTLPAGLHVNNASAAVCGGTITLANPSGISLSGAAIAPGTSCNVTVTVHTDGAGSYPIVTTVTSTEGGASPASSATLNVEVPPAVVKVFGAPTVPLNGTTSLIFTVQNFTTASNSAISFTDTLPAGLVVATPNGLTGSCGGGTITATAGSGSVSLTGGSVAANSSCTFSVNVTGTSAGAKNNTTGAVTSTGGTGGTASASLQVLAPPVIIKAFGAASVPLAGSTTLIFTIQNNNAGASLNGVGFTDALPSGLVVSTPNGLTGSCGGGTITATAGSGSASLTGGSIGAATSCTFSINVTGTSAGVKNNTTGNVTSGNGGTGGTASASITVVAPPSISKAFGAASIPPNGTTSLTFTIVNPSAGLALTGVAFTDNLPAGLVVAAPNGLTGSCGGGTITATAGSGAVNLAGATLAASASCTFAVNVTGTTAGVKNNTTGAVSSNEGGAGNTASASVAVVTNSFTGPTPSNGNATASFTGGGATCSYTRAAFIPVSGGAGSPPAGSAPANYVFPNGLFDFVTAGCTAGSTLNFTITYATALPSTAVYWKYGPTASDTTPHWYVLPATITGNTATFSITDGGLGDDDLTALGGIVDQGGPGVPLTVAEAPTLSEWAMILLAALLAAGAWLARRRVN